jgi:cell division protein FtsQ
MTGISDIFNPRPKGSPLQQAIPRESKKVRRSLLDMLFGPSPSVKKPEVPTYPVIKPMTGIEQPAQSPLSRLDKVSRLFGIKPDRTALENLQEQLHKEKPHGETIVGKMGRKMNIAPKNTPVMPSHAALNQKNSARGVVIPTRITPSTVRSINSPISKNSLIGRVKQTIENQQTPPTLVTTFVKPKPEPKPEPAAEPRVRPANAKEWILAFRANLQEAKIPSLWKASTAVNSTPIVSRRGTYGVPMQKQTQNKVRRQLYLALGASGAEIRVPALPIFNPSWRIISGLLAAACIAACAYMLYAPEFLVTSVEVKGLNRLDPERIQPILDLANRSVVFLDADLIKERVSQVLPELKDIRVSVDFPATISITLGERKPALVWDNNGNQSWIDTDGVLIPVQGDGGELLTILSDVPPPVWEISDKKEIVKARAAAGVQFTPQAKKSEDDSNSTEEPVVFGTQQVEPAVMSTAIQLSTMMPVGAQLIYNSRYGFVWNDQLQNLTVYIGQNLDYLDVKMNEYSAIMIALQKDGIKPGMISLEHVHAPFYRLERQ